MDLLEIYKNLLKKYGRQHWWPADSQYEVVVGALLTQNTNWKNVEKAINNLKQGKVLTPEKILKINLKKLKKLIRPAGYYNQKAPRLKELTRKYLELNKKNKKPNKEKLREELLKVKGVGKETADSIILYAFDKPLFVIDAYTKRFCKKYFSFEAKEYDLHEEPPILKSKNIKKAHSCKYMQIRRHSSESGKKHMRRISYDDYRKFFENNLPKSVLIYKEFHALIVEWGKNNKN